MFVIGNDMYFGRKVGENIPVKIILFIDIPIVAYIPTVTTSTPWKKPHINPATAQAGITQNQYGPKKPPAAKWYKIKINETINDTQGP